MIESKNMNTKRKIIIFSVFCFLLLVPLFLVLGTEVNWPSAPLTGVSLGDKSEFHEFIAYMYGWGIQLGIIIFFVMLVVAGIQYMTSGSGAGITSAKARIRNAILGLALLLGSWLILNTINPRITQLTPLPPLWDTDLLEKGVILTSEQLEEPPCAFLLLYSETDYGGSETEIPPGEYKESPDFKSGKSFRKMTESEKEMLEEMENAEITYGREVRGEFIEGSSCFLTVYEEKKEGLFFPSPCGKVVGTVTGFPIQNFDKFIYEDEISCYKVESTTKEKSSGGGAR
jgi:hypothetical protein